MPLPQQQPQQQISEQEYLDGELLSEVKHEFIDGSVYAMAEASADHGRIAGNLFAAFLSHLQARNIPSMEEYVLIEQDFVDIEICRRKKHWRPEHYYLGDEVHLASIDLTLPVEDIYARVMNDDMQDHRKNTTTYE